MSSSSIMRVIPRSLHLVEHVGKRRLQLERLLDLFGGDKGVLPVFQEARALVFAKELADGGQVRLPVLQPSLELEECRRYARLGEEGHRILEVLVEIGVEDALVHEVETRADVEEDPAEIVKSQRSEDRRIGFYRVLDRLPVIADRLLPAG